MTTPNQSRRNFLRTSALAGVGLGVAATATTARAGEPTAATATTTAGGIVLPAGLGATRPRPAGQKPVHDLTTKPLQKVRVAHIGLSRGMTHVNDSASIEFCEVVAVCDIRADRAQSAADNCE